MPDLSDRELDCRIAERLFGKTVIGEGEWCSLAGGGGVVPHYSTDPTAAHAVIERMQKRGWTWDALGPFYQNEGTEIRFSKCSNDPVGKAKDASFCRAVCLAALAALAAVEGQSCSS